MIMFESLRVLRSTVAAKSSPMPTATDDVSVALQWAGLLSLLLFLVRNVF